jgi:hypothetical protein
MTMAAALPAVVFAMGLQQDVANRLSGTCAVNDNASTIDGGGSPVKVKSKWDKQSLKQEFSNTQAKLAQTWSVDGADHLALTAKLESLTLVTPERKAIFDRR